MRVGAPVSLNIPSSDMERIQAAARRAIPLLPETVRLQVASFLTPEALKIMCAVGAAWGASHWIGVGELIDVVLLGVGTLTIGYDLIRAGQHFEKFYDLAKRAQTDNELNAAARELAVAITVAGIDSLIVFFAKTRVPRLVPAALIEEVAAEAATISFPKCTNGALWSKIGEARAEQRAAADGLVTMEVLLKKQKPGLYSLLKSLDKVVAHESPTGLKIKAIWESLSGTYAKNLTGEVTVYVDLPKLLRANRAAGSKMIEALQNAKPGETIYADKDAAILLQELDVATDFVPNGVTTVVVKDITGGMGAYRITAPKTWH